MKVDLLTFELLKYDLHGHIQVLKIQSIYQNVTKLNFQRTKCVCSSEPRPMIHLGRLQRLFIIDFVAIANSAC